MVEKSCGENKSFPRKLIKKLYLLEASLACFAKKRIKNKVNLLEKLFNADFLIFSVFTKLVFAQAKR